MFRASGKIRVDVCTGLDIFSNIPGFYLEGEEYRRPHYWTIWRWDADHAKEAAQQPARNQPAQPRRPQPPRPPTTNSAPPRQPTTRTPDGFAQRRRGPRPASP